MTARTAKMPDCLREIFAFEKALNEWEAINARPDGIIDMSRVRFIEPYSLAGLLLLGRNHLRASGEKLRLTGMSLPVHQYLSRMDFFAKGVYREDAELPKGKKLSRSSESRKVIELTDIPNKERDSVKAIGEAVTLFRKRASHILRFFVADNTADMLVTAISELCQNVFEHSLDSGYFAAQAYDMERAHIVRLVIADSGIGIEESFTANRPDVTERGAELIHKAFSSPISSKRPFGYGLCQVNAIVGRLSGSLFIRSGASSVAVVHKGSRRGTFLKNGLTPFPGTQISITLSSD